MEDSYSRLTLTIDGMHCSSCALNIDFELEDLDGVHESKTHYAKQLTIVTFDPDKVQIDTMLKIIDDLGYQASIQKEDNHED